MPGLLGSAARLSTASPGSYPYGGFLPAIVHPGNMKFPHPSLSMWTHDCVGPDYHVLEKATRAGKHSWCVPGTDRRLPAAASMNILAFVAPSPDTIVFFLRIQHGQFHFSLQHDRAGNGEHAHLLDVLVFPTISTQHAYLLNNHFYFGLSPEACHTHPAVRSERLRAFIEHYRTLVRQELQTEVRCRIVGSAMLLLTGSPSH